MNLVARVMATQKTVDAFKGKKFDHGRVDCVQLAKVHAKHMGGNIEVPRYGSRKSAAAAMREMGIRKLGDALDRAFTRIEPVRVLAGDIIEMPGENGLSSLAIAVGNGRVLGFHESIPHCDVLQPVMVTGAWRID